MYESKAINLFAAWALALPALVWAETGAVNDFKFQVLLDDKPIGFHNFRIVESEARKAIEIDAQFDVQVLFVPVYTYRHHNRELWRDGCLARIDSETNANGERYAVRGRRSGPTYTISTASATQSHPVDCLMSFAYWDRQMLQQERLLNAQTGEVIEVNIKPLGEAVLTLGSEEVAADGYRIVAEPQDVDIQVWYARSDGRWLALESRLASGRMLRYVPAEADLLAWSKARAVSTVEVR
jgi:hypothetical protein